MADSKKLDTTLSILFAVSIVAVLGFAAYFGFTVFADRQAAEAASPAMRVVKVLNAQVKQAPNDPVMRVRLGEALAAAGKPQEAIAQLNAALKIDPKHTGANLDLGLLASSQNRPDEARAYFQKVIELTEGSNLQDVNQRRETAIYNLGLLALESKDYNGAIGHFKEALRIRGDASDTYFYLGRAFLLSGQAEAAVKPVQTALVFDPNFAQAHYLLGEIYMAQNDKVNASYEFHKAATINPKAPEPQAAVAKFGTPAELIEKATRLKESDPGAALDEILVARNLDPENAAAAIVHGEILIKRGDQKDALAVYREALKLDPKDAKVQAIVKQLAAKYDKK